MNPELKARWVKALRSGKYLQGNTMLYDQRTDTYCCLGVLHICAGYAKESIDRHTFKDSARLLGGDPETDGNLATVNDDGVPFEMIAGLIDSAL